MWTHAHTKTPMHRYDHTHTRMLDHMVSATRCCTAWWRSYCKQRLFLHHQQWWKSRTLSYACLSMCVWERDMTIMGTVQRLSLMLYREGHSQEETYTCFHIRQFLILRSKSRCIWCRDREERPCRPQLIRPSCVVDHFLLVHVSYIDFGT